jgi:hypothetical protein
MDEEGQKTSTGQRHVVDKLLSEKLIIEASYSNEDNKKQKPIKKVYLLKELQEGLKEIKTSRQ